LLAAEAERGAREIIAAEIAATTRSFLMGLSPKWTFGTLSIITPITAFRCPTTGRQRGT